MDSLGGSEDRFLYLRSNEASSVMNSLIEVDRQRLVNTGFGPLCGLK